MAGNNYFRFKQFSISQEKSAMKIGTDSILLGAWVNIENTTSILDVGAGTGIISLMLAQRCAAKIYAVEIEKTAEEEATENINNSPWKHRISVENISFQNFNPDIKFDLIVSNPPFFSNDLKSKTTNRNLARHNDLLPVEELITISKKHLTENGRLALILPSDAAKTFILKATDFNLPLIRLTEIKPKPDKLANRFLMEFGTKKTALTKDCFTIYNSLLEYTSEFRNLTKDFYLKF